MTSIKYALCAPVEEQVAFLPECPPMREVGYSELFDADIYLWRGNIEIRRKQYSLWMGGIFLGEIWFDKRNEEKPWRAELSTQKYLKTVGRYKTETEAHGALLDAAVDALNKE